MSINTTYEFLKKKTNTSLNKLLALSFCGLFFFFGNWWFCSTKTHPQVFRRSADGPHAADDLGFCDSDAARGFSRVALVGFVGAEFLGPMEIFLEVPNIKVKYQDDSFMKARQPCI